MRLVWNLWTAELRQRKQLSVAFLPALQAACFAYGRAIQGEQAYVTNPENWRAGIAADRAWKLVLDACSRFGLTLASNQMVTSAQLRLKFQSEQHDILA
jgi:hypothetical protein